LNLSYVEFVVPLINAVQEQQVIIDELELRIERMKGWKAEKQEMEARLNKLETMDTEIKGLKALVKQLATNNDFVSNNK